MLVVEEEAGRETVTFRVRALGQVASGGVDVADDHVQLEVTLPWLLHKFAQVVQQTISGRGRVLLEKKIAGPRAAPAGRAAIDRVPGASRSTARFGSKYQHQSWSRRGRRCELAKHLWSGTGHGAE
jgi:Putative polyhydroxyalkanoic acid system protein (PHA_gran_rgn)